MKCLQCISVFQSAASNSRFNTFLSNLLFKNPLSALSKRFYNETQGRPLYSTYSSFNLKYSTFSWMNRTTYLYGNSCLPTREKYQRHYRGFQAVPVLMCNNRHNNTPHYTENATANLSKDSGRQSAEYKENIWTVPNLLTTSRIICTPFLGYMVTNESFTLGLGVFVFAGITDLLDGFIARTFTSQRTAFGTYLDPLADKLLISVLTVTLTVVHLIPVWLTVLIVCRDVGLIGAAFYIRFKSLSPPKTLSRYFDVCMPSAKLYPSTISKLNTALQLSLVAFTIAAPVFNYVNHPALQTLWYITAVSTFASGWGYVRNGWSHVKILNKR